MTNEQFAETLDFLADLYRRCPELPVPSGAFACHLFVTFHTKREFDALVCALDALNLSPVVEAREDGTLCFNIGIKDQDGNRPGAFVKAWLSKEVWCEPIYEETEEVVPAVAAAPEYTEIRKKRVGWKCEGELMP